MADGPLEGYLAELRARLHGLPEAEISDIIEELRSHVRDGWWIMPLGLLLGAAAFWLTPRFARWVIRRFRREPLGASR